MPTVFCVVVQDNKSLMGCIEYLLTLHCFFPSALVTPGAGCLILLLNPKACAFVMSDDFLYLDVSDTLSFQQLNGFRLSHAVQAVCIFTSAFLVDEVFIHGKSAVKCPANHPVIADVHFISSRPVACRDFVVVAWDGLIIVHGNMNFNRQIKQCCHEFSVQFVHGNKKCAVL